MGHPFNENRAGTTAAGQIQLAPLLIVVALIVLAVAAVGYFLMKDRTKTAAERQATQPKAETKLPRMANQPPPKPLVKPPPPPAYTPDAPVLEKARRALKKGVTPEEAVSLARSLPESPERADAVFLLLEYAADSGNPEAALDVGRYYDPSDDGPSGTIRKNPETARDWYRQALKGGRPEAQRRLDRLRGWLEEQARQGSREARDLLNHWE